MSEKEDAWTNSPRIAAEIARQRAEVERNRPGLLLAAAIIEDDEAPYFGEDMAKTLRAIAARLRTAAEG